MDGGWIEKMTKIDDGWMDLKNMDGWMDKKYMKYIWMVDGQKKRWMVGWIDRKNI